MKRILSGICMLTVICGYSQTNSNPFPVSFSGYVETYYCYDFGNPDNHTRPDFVYSHNRHNEVTLNLGMLKTTYEKGIIRANLALMAGTYTNANLAAEPGVLKNIYEANTGIKVSKNKNLWIDAGIFPSHIGFESAIGKDCWNMTRSILADNSPYYETGTKISYTSDNGKLFLSGLLLNGWQRIQRVEENNTPSFGHQLTYKPNGKTTLNSSSFIGNDKPDSVRRMRYFHNLYGIFEVSKRLSLTAGFDIGAEQKSKNSSSYNCWYAPILLLRFSATNKINLSLRGEYYDDPNAVIISTGTAGGFKTWGYSLNVDYLIRENILWRVECRGFSSKDKVFEKNGQPASDNMFAATSLAVSF